MTIQTIFGVERTQEALQGCLRLCDCPADMTAEAAIEQALVSRVRPILRSMSEHDAVAYVFAASDEGCFLLALATMGEKGEPDSWYCGRQTYEMTARLAMPDEVGACYELRLRYSAAADRYRACATRQVALQQIPRPLGGAQRANLEMREAFLSAAAAVLRCCAKSGLRPNAAELIGAMNCTAVTRRVQHRWIKNRFPDLPVGAPGRPRTSSHRARAILQMHAVVALYSAGHFALMSQCSDGVLQGAQGARRQTDGQRGPFSA